MIAGEVPSSLIIAISVSCTAVLLCLCACVTFIKCLILPKLHRVNRKLERRYTTTSSSSSGRQGHSSGSRQMEFTAAVMSPMGSEQFSGRASEDHVVDEGGGIGLTSVRSPTSIERHTPNAKRGGGPRRSPKDVGHARLEGEEETESDTWTSPSPESQGVRIKPSMMRADTYDEEEDDDMNPDAKPPPSTPPKRAPSKGLSRKAASIEDTTTVLHVESAVSPAVEEIVNNTSSSAAAGCGARPAGPPGLRLSESSSKLEPPTPKMLPSPRKEVSERPVMRRVRSEDERSDSRADRRLERRGLAPSASVAALPPIGGGGSSTRPPPGLGLGERAKLAPIRGVRE